MPIRRHITIDEFDDSADTRSPTEPMIPVGKPLVDPQTQTQPAFPSEDIETEFPPSYGTRYSGPNIGRTFPDLLVEFKNDPRAMVIILTIIPVIIFVIQEISLDSLIYALSLAVILNILWFGIPMLVSRSKKKKRRSVEM